MLNMAPSSSPFARNSPPICAKNCRASPTMAANISHRDFSYRRFIHLICNRVIPKMMALIDTKRKQVNCRRNKLSISLFFYIWHLSRPAFHSLCPWGVNPLQKYKYFFKTNNLLPAFCVMFFRLPSNRPVPFPDRPFSASVQAAQSCIVPCEPHSWECQVYRCRPYNL